MLAFGENLPSSALWTDPDVRDMKKSSKRRGAQGYPLKKSRRERTRKLRSFNKTVPYSCAFKKQKNLPRWVTVLKLTCIFTCARGHRAWTRTDFVHLQARREEMTKLNGAVQRKEEANFKLEVSIETSYIFRISALESVALPMATMFASFTSMDSCWVDFPCRRLLRRLRVDCWS